MTDATAPVSENAPAPFADVPQVDAETPVRVRFAPSPTGTPHVGLIRTVLFNWGWARHTGGTLVFRIEDTDAKRDSEESYQQLLEAMRWLGIDWDEGVEVGGPHEPYRQSQRGEIYADVIEKLKAGGYIYPSYSSPEETEARHRAAGRDPKLGYDGHDRDLTDEQIAAFEAEGRAPVWRLRMPDEDITFTDLVRGEITFKAGSVPDFVVVRADGSPLYTLVNPVDDALMGITHVLRGEDLLSSTPRQIALYRALHAIGVARYMPVFGHLPYVMGEGNKKLSKRDTNTLQFIEDYRKKGYLPEAVFNFIALLGWNPGGEDEIFSREELIKLFDENRLSKSPAAFDQKKLDWMSNEYIKNADFERIFALAKPYLEEAGRLTDKAEKLVELYKPQMKSVDEIVPLTDLFFSDFPELTDAEREVMFALQRKLLLTFLASR